MKTETVRTLWNAFWALPSTLLALPMDLYRRYHLRQASGYAEEATLRRQRLRLTPPPPTCLYDLESQLWARDYKSLDYLDFMAAYHTARATGRSMSQDYRGTDISRPW